MVLKRRNLISLFRKILLILSVVVSALVNSVLIQGMEEKERPYLRKASEHSDGEEFDYIVIGGGTAGCPLAATLSERSKVAVLERGGSPYGNVNISKLDNFHICLADTSPESPSQAFVSTDGVINSRARVLGGGTCINAGFYTRASPRFIRDMGWDGNIVNESYSWIEKQIVQKPEIAPWQAAVRDGLLEAGVSPFNGYTYDHLYGTKFGGTLFDSNDERHTAAELLRSGNTDNLRVYLHANVHKIVFDDRRGGGRRMPRAVGVMFEDEYRRLHTVRLRRNNNSGRSEVILSAGAIGSPQVLMLSGIGPKRHLKEMGIPVVLHNRYVGKGMSDNPMNSIFIPSKSPVKQSLIQTVGITKMGSYIEASSGFGQSSDSIKDCNHGIMSAEIGQLSTIPPKQRTLEAMKSYAASKHGLPREVFRGGFILEKIAAPLSRGNLRLADTDPRSNPSVTFNYFSHPADLRHCVYGIQTIARVIRTGRIANLTHDDHDRSMADLLRLSVTANVNLIPKHANDTQSLEQFCRDTVITIWHYHGGCHVGKVLDAHYRVLGVRRLRVVDGSLFVDSPGTNPQATVLMMGRYMGVKILRARSGRTAAGSRL